MAQTGLAVYAGDQILQTIHKLAGTALGLVYGMLIWYIGAGTGTGNRIGLGAAFFVFMIPPMALRIFAPPALMQFSMLGAVSVVLVVGYSWSNTHIPTLGSIGYGYSIAWRVSRVQQSTPSAADMVTLHSALYWSLSECMTHPAAPPTLALADLAWLP